MGDPGDCDGDLGADAVQAIGLFAATII